MGYLLSPEVRTPNFFHNIICIFSSKGEKQVSWTQQFQGYDEF
jgi:hypothetical protein